MADDSEKRARDVRKIEELLTKHNLHRTLTVLRAETGAADDAHASGGALPSAASLKREGVFTCPGVPTAARVRPMSADPFSCARARTIYAECGECFARQFTLNRHIQRKHRATVYHECDQCAKRYKNADDLVTHRISAHSRVVDSVHVVAHGEHVDTVTKTGELHCPDTDENDHGHEHDGPCGCLNMVQHDDHWDFFLDRASRAHPCALRALLSTAPKANARLRCART